MCQSLPLRFSLQEIPGFEEYESSVSSFWVGAFFISFCLLVLVLFILSHRRACSTASYLYLRPSSILQYQPPSPSSTSTQPSQLNPTPKQTHTTLQRTQTQEPGSQCHRNAKSPPTSPRTSRPTRPCRRSATNSASSSASSSPALSSWRSIFSYGEVCIPHPPTHLLSQDQDKAIAMLTVPSPRAPRRTPRKAPSRRTHRQGDPPRSRRRAREDDGSRAHRAVREGRAAGVFWRGGGFAGGGGWWFWSWSWSWSNREQ